MKTILQLKASPERSRRTLNILSTILFYLSILTFIIGFNFSDNRNGGWTQQFITVLNGQSINDIIFLDSLDGYAVTNYANGHSYIIKTTNSGNNWSIIYDGASSNYLFKKIKFINQDTGFVCGGIIENSLYRILKTTNAGLNWSYIDAPFQSVPQEDMSVLNEDTIWTVFSESLTGGVYRTTNGGGSWEQQINLGSQNPNHIYMFNGRIGFICEDNVYLRRTTNSGLNWDTVTGAGGFLDMYFADSLLGWKTSMQKTTDGGLNWVNQTLPQGGNIITSAIRSFSNVNRDTIWGVGGWLQYPNFQSRGMIYRTINGGQNWLFQVPDTAFNIFVFNYTEFVNMHTGWAYSGPRGIHTTNGGNDTFYTSIKQISSKTPSEFKLFQNYPNPFNPITNIKYEILNKSYINLEVFDVSGRLIKTMVNQKQNPGEYIVMFDGSNLSSGIYFYSMFIDGVLTDTKKMILLK